MISSTQLLGTRLLREIEVERCSLADILQELRTTVTSPHDASPTGIPELDALWKRHTLNGPLAITGRGMALIYHVVAHILKTLNGTVVILDLTARFSLFHLTGCCGNDCSNEELRHLHIFRPTMENLQVTLASLENYMLYGQHMSGGREWMATIQLGGDSIGLGDPVGLGKVNIWVGWRGWLRVEKEEFVLISEGVSIEDAWSQRSRSWGVDEGGWRAWCEEGEFTW